MPQVSSAPRSLRTLYDLNADRLWFGAAVLAGLVLAHWIAALVLGVHLPDNPAF